MGRDRVYFGDRISFISSSENETKNLAKIIYKKIQGNLGSDFLILIEGELGSGKTSFVKGLANLFGISDEEVTSPTFTIIQEYLSDTVKILHIDLYRLSQEEDLIKILAFATEKLRENYLVVFEWGEKVELYLTHFNYAKIKIEFGEDFDQRFITLYLHRNQ